jgi:hypothetical protein
MGNIFKNPNKRLVGRDNKPGVQKWYFYVVKLIGTGTATYQIFYHYQYCKIIK